MTAVMIGIDPHKASHTAVVISGSEEPLGELRVRASAWARVRWEVRCGLPVAAACRFPLTAEFGHVTPGWPDCLPLMRPHLLRVRAAGSHFDLAPSIGQYGIWPRASRVAEHVAGAHGRS